MHPRLGRTAISRDAVGRLSGNVDERPGLRKVLQPSDPARHLGGQRPAGIAKNQAIPRIPAVKPGAQEPGIERIASAGRIDDLSWKTTVPNDTLRRGPRALVPSHTPMDGDLVFATGARALANPQEALLISHAAAICLSRAIARGVFAARSMPGDPLPC